MKICKTIRNEQPQTTELFHKKVKNHHTNNKKNAALFVKHKIYVSRMVCGIGIHFLKQCVVTQIENW